MSTGYQNDDRAVIDYQLYDLPGIHNNLRGPDPSDIESDEYIVCAGAAQTFGRFAPNPYPTQLMNMLHVPVYNFGFAGGGPFYFLRNQRLLDFMSGARTCVLQVMSGRSASNSVFEVTGSGGTVVTRGMKGKETPRLAQEAYIGLLRDFDTPRIMEVIEETRQNWVDEMSELLERITCPVVLLWFSSRSPEYQISYTDIGRLFGGFPQLVNREMIDKIKPLAEHYVEAISDRGLPQPLINLKTGELENVYPKERFPNRPDNIRNMNNYYPSQEMHDDAFSELAPVFRG